MTEHPAPPPKRDIDWDITDTMTLLGLVLIGMFLSSIYFPLIYLWAGLVLLFLVRYG